MARKGVNAINTWKLRAVKRPGAGCHIFRSEVVAAISGNSPTLDVNIPRNLGCARRQQRILIQTKCCCDELSVSENLVSRHVLRRWHSSGLFQQRKINHRGCIAHGSGVSVPVPHSADVASRIEQSYVLNPSLFQRRTSYETREPGTNDCDSDVIVHGFTFNDRCVRVVGDSRKPTGRLEVLVVTIRAQPLISLEQIPLT